MNAVGSKTLFTFPRDHCQDSNDMMKALLSLDFEEETFLSNSASRLWYGKIATLNPYLSSFSINDEVRKTHELFSYPL